MSAVASREHERTFELFGSRVRLLVSEDGAGRLPLAEALLRGLHDALTRFDPASELCRLNADPRELVPLSRPLALALDAAARAHDLSGGLVDVTVLPELERAGYARSRTGAQPADLRSALDAAPPRRAAAARSVREFEVDLGAAVVRRPRGLRFDLGGIGKGLAADLAGRQLDPAAAWVADCGGDVRIGGRAPESRLVEVADPFSDGNCFSFPLQAGAVATSGLRTRVWKQREGFAHHLIDPGAGTPAWTGVAQATAVASTAVEAEALAKTALLLGPVAGAARLGARGGVLVLDDGSLITAGPVGEAGERAA